MTVLANRQFEIETTPLVPFGDALPIKIKAFSPGSAEVRNQDTVAARADHRVFGIDRRSPPTWSFSLFTDTYTETEAAATYDTFAQAWDNDVRLSPEAVVALRYRIMDRDMRVYGRPRRITPIYQKVHLGKIYIETDFDLSEDAYYEDAEQSISVGMGSTYTAKAGIVLPQKLPWSFTTTPAPLSFSAVLAGSQKTWITLTFQGPSTNPYVQIGNSTWGLTGSLASGQTATISGRPWDMGVWDQNGAVSNLRLDPRARLSQLRMAPGTYPVTYGAYDNSGSSRVFVRWRNARRSL